MYWKQERRKRAVFWELRMLALRRCTLGGMYLCGDAISECSTE